MNATTVVNLRREPYDIYIGRGSVWGNPFRIGLHGDRATVIKLYCDYLFSDDELLLRLPELQGKVLGCFCKPAACHGDLLAALADGDTP